MVIGLERKPHVPIDAVTEYFVAADCIEGMWRDIPDFCTFHEAGCCCVHQRIEFSGIAALVRNKQGTTPPVVCPCREVPL